MQTDQPIKINNKNDERDRDRKKCVWWVISLNVLKFTAELEVYYKHDSLDIVRHLNEFRLSEQSHQSGKSL